MKSIHNGNVRMFVLDAPGCIGKAFLTSLTLATVLTRSKIDVSVVFSGIAATLLESCRTACSVLKLPFNLQVVEEPTCSIGKHSAMAKVLEAGKYIIWNEWTMDWITLWKICEMTQDWGCIDFIRKLFPAITKKLQLSTNMRVAPIQSPINC